MSINFWKGLPTKIRRILTIVTFFFLSVIITVSGVLTPLTEQEIDNLGEELEETYTFIKSLSENLSEFQQISFIFGNNLMICLVGFAPIIGPVFEGYVLYSTGVSITAYAAYKHVQTSPVLLLFSLFLFPFTWLEFLAYSTAIAESFWLTWRIIQRKGRREIKNSCILISICAVMLLVAAIIEVAILSALEGPG